MKRNGFTLFEVLVALAILALVFSMIYLTFHQSTRVMAATRERAEVIQQGRLVLERVTGDLQGVFLPPGGVQGPSFQHGLVGRPGGEREELFDRLDFTTLSITSSAGGGEIREIGYFLEREAGKRGFTLFRREDLGIDGDLLRGGDSIALCEGVLSLGFSFFNRQGAGQREWNSLEGPQSNQLPARAEIRLGLEDEAGKRFDFRTQVFLPLSG